MCRFIAYMGSPLLLDDILYKPKNSLINQSVRAHESEEPLNGDGFGVGWYGPRITSKPAVFVSVRPAWNDRNLRNISSIIESPCIFAHVRAASSGDVGEDNCHPFHYQDFLFMHNGDLGGFGVIKRHLRDTLSDEFYNMIQGDTDSEHFFALFLNIYSSGKFKPGSDGIAACLRQTVDELMKIKSEHGVTDPDYLNIAITDGRHLVAIRFVTNNGEQPPTLYFSEGHAFVCHEGECRMNPSETENAVLVVSERLTSLRSQWKEIPVNSIVLSDFDNLQVRVMPF